MNCADSSVNDTCRDNPIEVIYCIKLFDIARKALSDYITVDIVFWGTVLN